MDIHGFREAQSPFFFTQPPEKLVETRIEQREYPPPSSQPVPDNRYPGFAGPMYDGRLATDYRSHCEVNIPTGSQFPTRMWMQRNGKQIIQTSRNRQSVLSGGGKPYDANIELQPIAVVYFDAKNCGYTPTNDSHGIGIERGDIAPPLFATWAPSIPSYSIKDSPMLTTNYEGGRNTPRGIA
jgi:hypothetical protein